MYEKIIENYIQTIQKEDIKKFAQQKGVELSDADLETIYFYLKNYWKNFYQGDPTVQLKELEQKLDPYVFAKLKQLYIETKNKFLS